MLFRPGSILSVTLFPLALAWGQSAFDTAGFSVSAGTEYQTISQEYYRAILDTTTIDPLESWRLTTNRTEDIFFRTSCAYGLRTAAQKLNILAGLDYSRERWIGKTEGIYTRGTAFSYLRFQGIFEARDILRRAEYWDQGYRRGAAGLKGRWQASPRVAVALRGDIEMVDFDRPTNPASSGGPDLVPIYYSYDQILIGTEFSGEFALAKSLESIGWRLGFGRRQVADSAAADYNRWRAGIDYSRMSANGYILATGGLEIKDYNQRARRNDYFSGELNAHASLSVRPSIDWLGNLNLRTVSFREKDVANRNHILARLQTDLVHDFTGPRAGPLFRWELYSEIYAEEPDTETGLALAEDYSQWEAGFSFNYWNYNKIYITAEITYGQRIYKNSIPYLSPFDLLSPAASVIVNITRKLSWQAYFDGQFEYHRTKEDNLSLYICSTSLTFRL